MKFTLQFGSEIKKIGYKFAHFWNYSFLFFLPFAIIMFAVYFAFLLMLIELQNAGITLFLIGSVNDETSKSILCVMIVLTLIIEYYIIWKASIYYVELTPKGVFIHHGNFVHFGLRQTFRMNVNVPYDRIVNCKKGVPVDCPPNYRYTYYSQLRTIKRYVDLKSGKDIPYMTEPAIAGGRYNEECILLELDNKRIIVIPIDECDAFLELFDQYMEKFKKLQKGKENQE